MLLTQPRLRMGWWPLLGPAFAVSIGYIDPGNWATDLAAGAFGFRLLWVVVLANLLAMALQVAVVRLAALTGEDLATTIARKWPRFARPLWFVFQGSAAATDLAEFTGIVLGLQLLFHWAIIPSAVAGLCVVGAALSLSGRRAKALDALLILTIGAVGLAFVYQLALLHPAASSVFSGLAPKIPNVTALLVVIGIIGATVMPHNLFLHSALVLKSCDSHNESERMRRANFFLKETLVALTVASVINGSILVVGASLHGRSDSIQHVFSVLLGLVGSTSAMLFGAALLLTGIAASTTATMAGDYIFGAFSGRVVNPWIRRALTLAPAAALLIAGVSATSLLIWSQVILALILPVVVIPLMLEYRRAHRVKGLTLKQPIYVGALAATIICLAFDGALIAEALPWKG